MERLEHRSDSQSLTLNAVLKEMRGMKEEIQGMEEKIQGMKEEMQDMRPMHESYLMIRERFLDVFIRDVLKGGLSKKSMAIESGNSLAHKGDCVTDSNLFLSGRRFDDEFMQVCLGCNGARAR